MRITVSQADSLSPADRKAASQARLGALLREAGARLAVSGDRGVALRLTDDADVHALNRQFRAEDHATDVLAFPADEGDWLGDIVISVERARAQRPDDVPAELRLLAVHGLLHCLGYDHYTASDARRMTEMTRSLLPDSEVPDLVPAE